MPVSKRKNVSNRGAPSKPVDEKKDPNNGLRGDQLKWMLDYKASRNLPSLAEVNRIAVDWFITAIESRVRGDVSASAMFDKMMEKEVEAEKGA